MKICHYLPLILVISLTISCNLSRTAINLTSNSSNTSNTSNSSGNSSSSATATNGTNSSGSTNSCDYITKISDVETGGDVSNIINNNSIVFAIYSKEGCGNCSALNNTLDSLIKEQKLCNGVIARALDWPDNKEWQDAKTLNLIYGINGSYGYSTPLCLLYKDGKCINGYSGYKSENDLLEFLNDYLVCEDCVVNI